MTPDDGNAARAIEPADEHEQYEADQHEHDAVVALRPHERRQLEQRSGRAARVAKLDGAVQAWARLRPEDRKLMEEAVATWGKMLSRSRDGQGIDPLVRKVWEGGQRKKAAKQSRARFKTTAIDPTRVSELDETHSAVETAHTIFPKSVTAAWDTDRLLVSGHNNAKLGKVVEKGAWEKMPIFHLTLEERATCPGPDPRTGEGGCPLWRACLPPDARVLTADLRWVAQADLAVGDKIVGFDEEPVGEGRWGAASGHRMTRTATIEALGRDVQACYRITTDRGDITASSEHLWLARRMGGPGAKRAYPFDWIASESLKPGAQIRFLATPWEQDESYDAGRVRGFVEGEGHVTVYGSEGYTKARAGYAQRPGPLLDEINEIVSRDFNIRSRLARSGVNSSLVAQVDLKGGWKEVWRFLGKYRPTRLIERAPELIDGHSINGRASEVATVLSVEPIGEREVVTIQTSTRTMIAEGYFSHNCYGNAMHLARRHDARSENFLDFLQAELWLMARSFPDGFVVRLHTLGDFYSVEYVEFWRDLLTRIKALRVWGYTARLPGDPIRDALQALTDEHWDRFAIRWSNTHGYQGAIVVDDIAEAGDAIPCPAQHTAAEDEAKTESCSACGLCWAGEARGKTIAFLRHGMKTRGASDADAT